MPMSSMLNLPILPDVALMLPSILHLFVIVNVPPLSHVMLSLARYPEPSAEKYVLPLPILMSEVL